MVTNIKLSKVVISDVLILAFVYLIPTFSHLLAFPLYLLDPMRIMVLGNVIFLADKRNAYFLALSLPLFSYFIGGHPIIIKSLLIVMELIANIAILSWLESKLGKNFFSIFSSIVVSKCLYYALKYLLITIGLLDATIVATDFKWQLIVAALISITYLYTRRMLV